MFNYISDTIVFIPPLILYSHFQFHLSHNRQKFKHWNIKQVDLLGYQI